MGKVRVSSTAEATVPQASKSRGQMVLPPLTHIDAKTGNILSVEKPKDEVKEIKEVDIKSDKIVSNENKGHIIPDTASRPAEGDPASFRQSPASPTTPVVPKVKVRLSGVFGEMGASFRNVIINTKLVILVIPTDEDTYYIPPTSTESVITVEVQGSSYTVVNPGLQFEDGKFLYIILVKVAA